MESPPIRIAPGLAPTPPSPTAILMGMETRPNQVTRRREPLPLRLPLTRARRRAANWPCTRIQVELLESTVGKLTKRASVLSFQTADQGKPDPGFVV